MLGALVSQLLKVGQHPGRRSCIHQLALCSVDNKMDTGKGVGGGRLGGVEDV